MLYYIDYANRKDNKPYELYADANGEKVEKLYKELAGCKMFVKLFSLTYGRINHADKVEELEKI